MSAPQPWGIFRWIQKAIILILYGANKWSMRIVFCLACLHLFLGMVRCTCPDVSCSRTQTVQPAFDPVIFSFGRPPVAIYLDVASVKYLYLFADGIILFFYVFVDRLVLLHPDWWPDQFSAAPAWGRRGPWLGWAILLESAYAWGHLCMQRWCVDLPH